MRETTENSDSEICTHYILQETRLNLTRELSYFYSFSFSLNYKCVCSMEQILKIYFFVIPIVLYHVSQSIHFRMQRTLNSIVCK